MLVKITGSEQLERQTQLYSLVVEKLQNGQKVYMISNDSWQDVIIRMFDVPNFDANRLRAMQNDEFVLVSPQDGKDADIVQNCWDYDVFVFDNMGFQYLSDMAREISTIEASHKKTIIIN